MSSNIFAMFDQKQIAEFKEAFSFMDQNSDGLIDRADLREILTSLGRAPSEEELNEMLGDVAETGTQNGGLNFTLFLAMMADRMQGVDCAADLKKAFEVLDEKREGAISATLFREYLTTLGDRLTDEEVDTLLRGVDLDSRGRLDYGQFVKILTHSDLTSQ